MKKEIKIGTYRKNQKGFGFVKLEDQEDEIYISKENCLNALNGDTVSIEIIVPKDKANDKKEEGCCCNNSKASYLANSVSPVSIFINSSALTTNPVSNLQVISVTDSIAWFFDTETRRVYVICLNNIVALN